MQKKTVILVILLIVSLCLVFCFVLTAKIFRINKNSNISGNPQEQIKKVDHATMVKNYQTDIKLLVSRYKGIRDSMDNKIYDKAEGEKQIKELKNQMTELVVPVEYKDLHMNLFLSIVSLEKFLTENDSSAKKESEELFNKEILANDWLNK